MGKEKRGDNRRMWGWRKKGSKERGDGELRREVGEAWRWGK